MPLFAELDDQNIVVRVLSVNESDCLDENNKHSEQVGIEHMKTLFGGNWIETHERGTRRNIAGVGMKYFEEPDAFMHGDPPSSWYEVGESGIWKRPPNINGLTHEPFTHDELRYIGYYVRNSKLFIFCPAIPIQTSGTFFNNETDTKLFQFCESPQANAISDETARINYMFPMFSEVVNGENITSKELGATVDGSNVVLPGVDFIKVVVNAVPVGVIEEIRLNRLFWDVVFHYHPQSMARTPHELFRLILEWDFAYKEFGNREIIAQRCHDLVEQLNVPLDVRDDLIAEVPAQAVELYIRGLDPFQATSFDIITDPPAPESFEVWYATISSPI